MVNEELSKKSVAIVFKANKLLFKSLFAAIKAYLDGKTNKLGEVAVKDLAKQGGNLMTVDINIPEMKHFEKIAKKYGVTYSLMQDKANPDTYTIFFKGRQETQIYEALKAFKQYQLDKKPSVIEKMKAYAKNIAPPVKNKKREQTL
jgi:hypothetical protein